MEFVLVVEIDHSAVQFLAPAIPATRMVFRRWTKCKIPACGSNFRNITLSRDPFEFDDGNPYAPPPLTEETMPTSIGSESGFHVRIDEPRRFTTWGFASFTLVSAFGGVLVGALFVGALGLLVIAPLWGLFVSPIILTSIFLFVFRLLYLDDLAAWIAKPCLEEIPSASEPFLVQLTLHPRLCQGLRRLDDADDIGYLYIDGETLRFEGDRCRLSLPRRCIARPGIAMQFKFPTLRYYVSVALRDDALHDVKAVEFGSRKPTTMLGHYRESKRITAMLRQWEEGGFDDTTVTDPITPR